MPSVPIAARRLRGVDALVPIVEKSPPTYTVDPDTANALTPASGFGSHAVAVPSESMAARLFRSLPLIAEKFPPTYTVDPDTASDRTLGELLTVTTFGFHAARVPSVPMAARLLRVVDPIVSKVPPTYTVEPDTANVFTVGVSGDVCTDAFGFHGARVPSVPIAARWPRSAPWNVM
ncbi:unannotated protein [freshwater metagenome]|uniref:Unannotated protein n=1 Tax=freshwater metagenome TaxID=449393 RepID=A0A6J7PZL5_9ZZZZ